MNEPPLYHDDQTIFKVLRALISTGLTEQAAITSVHAMQNAGILFREHSIEPGETEAYSVPYVLPHSRACGWKPHTHGLSCHSNCPTCHGQDNFADTDWFKESQEEEKKEIKKKPEPYFGDPL